MAKFTAKLILTGTSELDDLIFQRGQNSLNRDLNEFVEAFETNEELLPLDALAKTYVQLTNCDQKMKSTAAVDRDTIETTITQSQTTLDLLTQVLDKVETARNKTNVSSFQLEREAYLISLQEKRKTLEKEIQRESDKMEEYYAKQTRDSIYRNLVGGNNHAWGN